jgi:hypothetical protein
MFLRRNFLRLQLMWYEVCVEHVIDSSEARRPYIYVCVCVCSCVREGLYV